MITIFSIFFISLFCLCIYLLLLRQFSFSDQIDLDALANDALECLEINNESLTLEEKNKCIDIILKSKFATRALVKYYSNLIPASRIDECYNCTKKVINKYK